ncbi:MAG: iron ABC transporter permease, partial [Alphaproteobacteria bacterium]|nr:iron ABC transporter permease [Alphaproteobacteria bacterium]
MVATFLSNWTRIPKRRVDIWSLGTWLLCCFLLGPVLALLATALGESGGLWEHLLD